MQTLKPPATPWIAYTGSLLSGRGRAIGGIVNNHRLMEKLLPQAQSLYSETPRAIQESTFIPAIIPPLAIHELGADFHHTQPFTSMQQVCSLFEDMDALQASAQLLNGILGTQLAFDNGSLQTPAVIASSVHAALQQGALIVLPRDAARLHTPELQSLLPGTLLFLLRRQLAGSKSFATYLRHGGTPAIPRPIAIEVARVRRTFRTWEQEARIEAKHREAAHP